MAKRRKTPDDFDSPWKDALQIYLQLFLKFYFPHIHDDIDWSRNYVSLDKEFQQIVRQAKQGKCLADKLFKVWTRDGVECWLLIHIEIQGSYDQGFPKRMFRYNVAANRLYNQTVVSLAVLCDDRPDWRPDGYGYGRWDCYTGTRFRAVKLLDFEVDLDALEKGSNPFARITAAHLRAIQTRQDPPTRAQVKLRIIKQLYLSRWSKDDIRQLFRIIDWILTLPVELEEDFRTKVHEFEEERKMPYLSSFERSALEKGRKEGLREGLLVWIAEELDERFGRSGRKIMEQIKVLEDTDKIHKLGKLIRKATSLDEVRDLLK